MKTSVYHSPEQRDAFRAAFAGFDPDAVAAFNFVAIRGDGLGCIPWVSTRSRAASAATP